MNVRYIGGMVAVTLVLFALGCGGGQENVDDGPVTRTTNVNVYTVSPMQFEQYITLPVVVMPNREVDLALPNGGEVTTIHVDKGSRVRKGDVLLETDDVLLKAQLDMVQSNLEYQEHDFERNSRLHEQGSITDAAFDASELQLAQARSNYTLAKKQYENATLEAPFAGTIVTRSAELGAILSPGVPAFRLIDMRTVKVQTGIPEKYIRQFEEGSSVSITFDAYPERTFAGIINYLSPQADTGVRTFMAEILVDNSDRQLKVGIMGDASVQEKAYDDAIVIPLNALIESQEGRVVYVIDNNVAKLQIVEISGTKGEYVHIANGLSAGDKVVVVGQHMLVDGEQVNVMDEVDIDQEEVSAQ